MTDKQKYSRLLNKLILASSVLLANVGILQAQILDEGVMESVDAQTLQQEIAVFTTIQRGISLSVAECELTEACNASVNTGEVERLISVIDTRVNALSLRYSETNDASLEGVLVGYADVRDSYKAILDKMGAMPRFARQEAVVDELAGDDFFAAGAANNSSVPNALLQLFQDADEEIVDDVIEEESALPATNQ